MKKELKDYLHFYLGCQMQFPISESPETKGILTLTPSLLSDCHQYEEWGYIKLILRKLTDATREETDEFNATKEFQLATPVHVIGCMIWTAKSFKWLLDRGFDIFGLIDDKLAIDAATYNKNDQII